MPVTVIDKIKQKNNGSFSLLDYIDIHGRITGWQNPVKRIIADVASIGTLTDGDLFILIDAQGTWTSFQGVDIYGRIVSAEDNAIYQKQTDDDEGSPAIYYLVASPAAGMITVNLSDSKLKIYNGSAWVDVATGGGTVTGETLRAKTEFTVAIGTNYNTTSHQLILGITLLAGDNINIYVNGLKYSHLNSNNAFTFTAGNNYVVWIPNSGNAGFELIDGDAIEVEIFNEN